MSARPDRNPQAEQMADESMVRNLAAQAEAIWPQERALCLRYDLPAGARILDVGCGTGEITRRLAELFPSSHVEGVDIVEPHLELARSRSKAFGERITYERGDAYALERPDGAFDLTVCRHMLQAVPEIELVLAELVRVTRPGGVVHVLAEDYAMMHFPPVEGGERAERGELDPDDFWRRGPLAFATAQGTDLRSGRRVPELFLRLGLTDVAVDYVVVDTLRVPREVFAEIWTAWRDGYAAAIGRLTDVSEREARATFDRMIATLRDPTGYAVWHVPVISGRAP